MFKKNRLAIVIPAYKDTFFKETLESMANQTCKDFTLYVGNDNSPFDIYSILKEYEKRITIIYNNFNENLGGSNLVAQWNRCIDLVREEEWIWLFSDDDTMEANCVELFYDCINDNPNEDLLHFNVSIIDEHGNLIVQPKPYPDYLSSSDFFSSRITSKINSYAVEYIFKRELYNSAGKFESFDLGWNADDATWIKFSKNKSIKTIPGALVNWRYSKINISSNLADRKVILRKLDASIAYLEWIKMYFKKFNLNDSTTDFKKFKSLFIITIAISSLPIREKYGLTIDYLTRLGYRKIRFLSILYLTYFLFKKLIAK